MHLLRLAAELHVLSGQTCCPNKAWTTINAVDRQAGLRRPYKITEEVNQQSLLETFSIRQDLDAVLIKLLSVTLPQTAMTPSGKPPRWGILITRGNSPSLLEDCFISSSTFFAFKKASS